MYNAISASDLTYQSGGFITSPEQFVGTDSDGDGIPDLVELYGLKPNGEPIGTDPYSNDTDGDGILDSVELQYIAGNISSDVTMADYVRAVKMDSDPTKVDTDEDGLDDNLDDVPSNASIHSFLIYETEKTDEDLKLCTGNCSSDNHNDYHYADISEQNLKNIDWINWSDFWGVDEKL